MQHTTLHTTMQPATARVGAPINTIQITVDERLPRKSNPSIFYTHFYSDYALGS